jgi:hypothetical protein
MGGQDFRIKGDRYNSVRYDICYHIKPYDLSCKRDVTKDTTAVIYQKGKELTIGKQVIFCKRQSGSVWS